MKPGIYTAGPSGFTAPGRLWHQQVLLPKLNAAGFRALDPWASSDAGRTIDKALTMRDGPERTAALRDADTAAGAHNLRLLERAHGVLALLDGVDVDSGTAAEIGYAFARRKVIVGLRTDLRLASDNAGAVVNLQVQHFVEESGGAVVGDVDESVRVLKRALRGLRSD